MKRRKWSICLALLLAAVCMGGIFGWFCFLADPPAPVNLSVSDEANDWDVYTLENGAKKPLMRTGGNLFDGLSDPGQIYYMSRILPGKGDAPVLLISHSECQLAVFLGGRQLYSDPVEAGVSRNEPVFLPAGTRGWGNDQLLLSLPEDYREQELTIALQSIWPSESGEVSTPPLLFYASMTELKGEYSTVTDRWTYPAGGFALIGILLLLLFCFQIFRGLADAGTVPLAMAALLWAGYLAAQGAQFLLDGRMQPIGFAMYHLSYLPLFLFLRLRMTGWRRWAFLPLAILYGCVAAAFTMLGFYGISDSGNWMLLSGTVLFAAALVCGIWECALGTPFYRRLAKWACAFGAGFAGCYLVSLLVGGTFATQVGRSVTGMFRLHYLTDLKELAGGFLLCASFGISAVEFVRVTAARDVSLRTLELRAYFMEKNAAQLQKNMVHVREIKHEINHHLQVLRLFSERGEYVRLAEYLAKVTERVDFIEPICYTDNPLLNAVLTDRISTAREHDVRMSQEIRLPQRLPIGDSDLCSFFMNLLDNAIEACDAMPQASERWIRLKIETTEGFLAVACVNSATAVAKEKNGRFLSSKEDPQAHGFGISTMRQIAARYHGALTIEQKPGRFTLKTVFSLAKPEEITAE